MRKNRKTFAMILVAYAVAGVLSASVGAKRLRGQQPMRVTVVPPVVEPLAEVSVKPQLAPTTGPTVDVAVEPIIDLAIEPVIEPLVEPVIDSIVAPEIETDFDFSDAADDDRDFQTRDEETIQKSFPLPAGKRSLEIDNIWGSIEVTADATDKVELTVHRTNRAESKETLEKAKKEVTLDISQDAGALKLYVNGPFRCQCDDCRHSHRDDDGYVVKMDFQLHVPKDIDLQAKTVNEGHVTVRGTNGTFLVRNVNGDIQMENVSGSGTARTVNGPVKVSFRENPRDNSDFKTINGAVELKFAQGLSADFRFKTFNGGIYSDFPVTAQPLHPMEAEHRGAKVIYRADRYTEARVNAGGPQIQVENLNGDIRILENHE